MRARHPSHELSPFPRAPNRTRVPDVGRSSAWSRSQVDRNARVRRSPGEAGARRTKPDPCHRAAAQGTSDAPSEIGRTRDRTGARLRQPTGGLSSRPLLVAIQSHPPARGGGRSARPLARDASSARPHCASAQPPLEATRARVLGSIPRPSVAHAARSADGARLRAPERATPRAEARGAGSVLVGALVRRMEAAARRGHRESRSAAEDLAPPDRLAKTRLHRARGVAGSGSCWCGDSSAAARELGPTRGTSRDASTPQHRVEAAVANAVEGAREEIRETWIVSHSSEHAGLDPPSRAADRTRLVARVGSLPNQVWDSSDRLAIAPSVDPGERVAPDRFPPDWVPEAHCRHWLVPDADRAPPIPLCRSRCADRAVPIVLC